MALALNDRVQQQGTANTTVSFTLTASVTGFQTFAVIGNGNTTYYAATDASGNWEVGIGTYSTTGPTLIRDTILASSNSGSAVTFSGTVNIFVTYPSEKSVNLDGSGNVSALGTISSGTWQGSTVGVAYGGTGVTASSGANSVVLRDANQNIAVNNVTQALTSTVSAAGTTTLTPASPHFQILTGSTTQTFKLPDATTLSNGSSWIFDNDSTGNLTIVDNASGTVDVVAPGGYATVFLESNATVAGTWGRFGMIPSETNWGTNSLDFGGSTVLTNGIWQGTTIGTAYGGTGLTGFGSANYALYSTSSSVLTAGTLPVAAGGTAATTFTSNGVLYGNGTGALGVTAAGTTGQVLVGNTGSAPSWGTLSSAAVTSFQTSLSGLTPNTATTGAVTLAGTLGATSGGTGLATYTTGDIIYASATNTLSKLGVGTNGQILTSNGTIPTWTTLSSSAVTTFSAGTTGFTPSSATSGAITLAGTLATTNGGTGLTSFTSGGAVYATSTSALTTGTLPIASGGTGQTTASAAFNALSPITTAGDLILGNGTNSATRLGIGTNGYVLTSNGTTASWAAASSGVTVTNDTSTATALYPTFTNATSGSISGVSVTSTKLNFTPSTGALAAPEIVASNGMLVHSTTVTTSYSIPAGSNAIAAGPMTVASGAAVTIPSGSRWLVL